jgi:hypothetical protein
MHTDTLAPSTCVVRNTAARKGRTRSVAAGEIMQHLQYGRIIVDAGDAPIRFDTGERETALVCLRGTAVVVTGETRVTLDRYDAIYVPRDSAVEVTAGVDGADLAEIASAVAIRRRSSASPTSARIRRCTSPPAAPRPSATSTC